MTKTQIWLAAFLVAFIFLFFLARITRHDDKLSNSETSNPVPQTNLTSEELGVEALLKRNGCVNCHGTELQGTPMAPPLANLKNFWTRQDLINYLRNPSSYMNSDRFKEFKEKYPGTIMPPYNNLDVKDLGKMADFLLAR